MKEGWKLVTGVLLGMFSFAMGTLVADVFDSTSDMNKKKQCEKTLPRNQHCVMIAVPVDKNETK